jgi:hypothetical protein
MKKSIEKNGKENVISRTITGYKLLKLSSDDRKVLINTLVKDSYYNSLDDVRNINISITEMLKNIYKNASIIKLVNDYNVFNKVNDINILLKISKFLIPIIVNNPSPNTKKIILNTPSLCAIKIKNKFKYLKKKSEINISGFLIPILNEEEFNKKSEEINTNPLFYLIPFKNDGNFKKVIEIGIDNSPLEYIKFFIGKNVGYKDSVHKINKELKKTKKVKIIPTKDIIYGNYEENKRILLNKVVNERFTVSDDLSTTTFSDDVFDSSSSLDIDEIVYKQYNKLLSTNIFLDPDSLKKKIYMLFIENLYQEVIVDYYKYIKNHNIVINIIKPITISICICCFLINLHLIKGLVKVDVKNGFVLSFNIKNKKNTSITDYYIYFMINVIKKLFFKEYKRLLSVLDINIFAFFKNTYELLQSKEQPKFLKKVDFKNGIINLPFLNNCFSFENKEMEYKMINKNFHSEISKNIEYVVGRNKKEFIVKINEIKPEKFKNEKKIIKRNKISKKTENKFKNYNVILMKITNILKRNNLIKSESEFIKNIELLGKLNNRLKDDNKDLPPEELVIYKNKYNSFVKTFYKTAFKELILKYGNSSEKYEDSFTYKYLFYKRILELLKIKSNIKNIFLFIENKILESKLTDISKLSISIKKFKTDEERELRNLMFYNMTTDEKILSGFDSMDNEQKEDFLNNLINIQTQGDFLQEPFE